MTETTSTAILLIEDEDIVATYLESLLTENGDYIIKRAACLEDARSQLAANDYQVILLDLNLPDSEGLQTLKAVLATKTTAAIIIMTGTNDEDLAAKALQQGAQDYLIKGQSNNMLIIKSIRYALERKQFHDQLQLNHSQMLQSEKMASIGQLAAGVAHEINNPMGFITSNLHSLDKYISRLTDFMDLQAAALASHPDQNLQTELADQRRKMKIDYIKEDLQDLINESLNGGQRVIEIVQGLRSFSRTDHGQYEKASINEIISDTIKIVWNELKYKTSLHQDFGDLPLVPCFPHQLGQVIMNLLVNAAQAIADQGEIRVKTTVANDKVTIAIADTGSGIAPDKVSQIFDPFFTTKEVGKGTGLGLSIAYDIITNKHHGTIDVASEVGKGTTFTITLPVSQEAAHD